MRGLLDCVEFVVAHAIKDCCHLTEFVSGSDISDFDHKRFAGEVAGVHLFGRIGS